MKKNSWILLIVIFVLLSGCEGIKYIKPVDSGKCPGVDSGNVEKRREAVLNCGSNYVLAKMAANDKDYLVRAYAVNRMDNLKNLRWLSKLVAKKKPLSENQRKELLKLIDKRISVAKELPKNQKYLKPAKKLKPEKKAKSGVLKSEKKVKKPKFKPAFTCEDEAEISRDIVMSVIRRNKRLAEHCGQIARKRDPTFHGRIDVLIEVKCGRVRHFEYSAPYIDDDTVVKCLKQRLNNVKFPISSQEIRVTYPFVFFKQH